ncbi:MAG TPA: hypothetical protein VIQ51_01910 [Chryseosolibacter sp.]
MGSTVGGAEQHSETNDCAGGLQSMVLATAVPDFYSKEEVSKKL